MSIPVIWLVAMICNGLALSGLLLNQRWVPVRTCAIIAFCGFAYTGVIFTRGGWITWWEHYGTVKELYAIMALARGYTGIILGTGILVAAFIRRG